MSKVISFRLNPDNPREAKALIFLENQLSQGFSIRHTLTDALVNLDPANSQILDGEGLEDLSYQIKELLTSIRSGLSIQEPQNNLSSKKQLSQEFIVAMKKAVKPGMVSD